MKEVNLCIIGYGNIGRGLAEVLVEKKSFLAKKHDLKFKVKAICEINGCLLDEKGIDLKKSLSKPLSKQKGFVKKKSLDVIKNCGCDILLELTPGDVKKGEPGLSHILMALDSGMDVVTSNKSPLALQYKRIMDYASKRNLRVGYEATVGGALPLINLYRNTLAGNEVKNIYGILNGTTNFILSKMSEEGVDFNLALKEAQELGIAETDCSYDVDGLDTAFKVVILANSILGKNVSFKDVSVSGIRDISPDAIELAKKHGSEVKLIGDVSKLEVSSRLIPQSHPLNISGALNAVLLETDVAGEVTVTGVGAGPRETSSSLLSDLIEVSKSRFGLI